MKKTGKNDPFPCGLGKYDRDEKADGTLVEIPELLELARKAALDAIAGDEYKMFSTVGGVGGKR